MNLLMHIREAFSNLLMSKLRSFLAILGVLVGTGSVVALIASSQLATAHALSQFKTLGTNLLALHFHRPVKNPLTSSNGMQVRPFVLTDMHFLRQSSSQIEAVAPYVVEYAPVMIQGVKIDAQVVGATEALADIAKIHLLKGRFVSRIDRHSFFCVIGDKLAARYRSHFIDPVGQQIKVGNAFFTIVGVAKPWPQNLFLFVDVNRGVIIPIQAAYLLQKNVQIENILIRLVKQPNIALAEAHIRQMFKVHFPHLKTAFRTPEQIIQLVSNQRKTFTWLLGAIGGIALIVGGIGVMNIMLVSVVERRREIGIRMAIGARQHDILSMFLIESIILTVFGGVLGILLGVLVSYILSMVTGWGFTLYFLPPILGFAVSVLVGVLSGYYPALRASRLDPIQCLQSD